MSSKIENVVNDDDINIEEMMEKVEKIGDQIKWRAFGKVTIGGGANKKQPIGEDSDDMNEEEKAKVLLKKQIQRADEQVKKVENENKDDRPATIFQIANLIRGAKKVDMEATAIKDPLSGKIVVSHKEIKKITLEYCVKNLEEKHTEEGYEKENNLRRLLHNKRMEERLDEGFEVTEKLFKKVASKVEKSGKRNYDFFVKAGDSYKSSMYQVVKRMVKEEYFPGSFDNTVLHMIFKGGKGKRKDELKANRFIHSKSWLPRLVEGVVVEEMKPSILGGSSRYQVGGQAGHRPQELLFVMRSIVAKYLVQGRLIMLQAYDISAFFDQEELLDVMDSLYKLNVDPRAWRCWYKLNQRTRIKVVTGVGATETAEVGECVGQGTKGGALGSQANLDMGVSVMFRGSEDEAKYGSVEIAPVMFQDDIMRAVDSVDAARAGNVKMDVVMSQKSLQLNRDKSVCILFGPKKKVEEVRKELETRPLVCGSFVTKEKLSDKWLGDMLVGGPGLGASVTATIEERLGKCKATCLEIVTIVEDLRAQVAGGFVSGLRLYEACVLPSLLNNSGTWTDIPDVLIKQLERFQNWFLRLMFRTGPGAPRPALRSETGMLSIEMRVWREKLVLGHHITHLDQDTLASQVWSEQVENEWPGLASEVMELCDKLKVDVVDCEMSKKEYRNVVENAVREYDESKIKVEMTDLKKTRKIKNDDCKRKKYIEMKCLKDVRDIFSERLFMLPFAANYKNDRRFARTNGKCPGCAGEDGETEIDDQEHAASSCAGYEDLRNKFDLDTDLGLVGFYRAVLDRRRKEEEERTL